MISHGLSRLSCHCPTGNHRFWMILRVLETPIVLSSLFIDDIDWPEYYELGWMSWLGFMTPGPRYIGHSWGILVAFVVFSVRVLDPHYWKSCSLHGHTYEDGPPIEPYLQLRWWNGNQEGGVDRALMNKFRANLINCLEGEETRFVRLWIVV